MQPNQIAQGSLSSNIPAEIGRNLTTFHNHIIISWHFRVSDIIAELQTEISYLRALLLKKPEFDVQLLKGNDKLTQRDANLYDSFMALVEYLEPKAKGMRVWKGSNTKTEDKQQGSQCFSNLSTANQFFAILV